MRTAQPASQPTASRRADLLLIGLVALAAGFFRLWRIDQVPPGLGYDEAGYGQLALQLLQGRTILAYELGIVHSYLAAPFVVLLGRTPLALRLPEALAGVAAAVMLYLFVREAFASRRTAFLAALIYAITFAAVHVNRMGFPSNILPLVQAATFYFFWRGWRLRGSRSGAWSLAASGLCVGLAVQSYYAGLAIVAGMGLAWVGWLWAERRRGLVDAAVFWGLFLIPTLPWLAIVAPQALGSPHTSGQFIFNAAVHEGEPWRLLVRQTLEHAGLFGFTGDQIWRHNLPGRPFFQLPLALFFWGGVALALLRVRSAPYAFLLIQLVMGILPGALARTDTGPVILHLTAMFVPACVFPALAVDWLAIRAGAWRRWAGPAVAAAFGLLLAVTAYRTYVDYFQIWAQGVADSMSFDELFVDTARTMNRNDGAVEAWVLPMTGTAGSGGESAPLDFIYHGAEPAIWTAANDATAGAVLQERLAGSRRVGLVTWDWEALRWAAPAYSDEKGLLRFLLDQNGRLVQRQEYPGYVVDIYKLVDDPAFTAVHDQLQPVDAAFGDGSLRLGGLAYGGPDGTPAAAGAPLWLALRWEAAQGPGRDLKAALMLVDSAGHVIVQDDQLLRDAVGATAATWPSGAQGLDLRLLDLPAGTPPGEYTVRVAVYDAASLERLPVARGDRAAARVAIAGPVTLAPADMAQQAVPDPPQSLTVTTGTPPRLLLAGHDPLPGQALPGDTLLLTTYWQALQDAPSAPVVQFELIDPASGAPAMSQPLVLSEGYPPSLWRAGQYVTDRRDVRLNRNLPAGVYSLQLAIDGGDGPVQRVLLGDVAVAGWPRQFEPPAAVQPAEVRFGDEMMLVGHAVGPAVAGQPLAVTLCWQALAEMDTSYVTFVHLLNVEGRLVSQDDAVPGRGAQPTTAWLAGEIICSDYELPLASDLAPGRYALHVGAYDPRHEVRLAARGGAGAVVNNDAFVIELEVGAD